MLELTDMCVHYGRVAAVRDLSLKVREGEVVGLVGHNGAGKSSTLLATVGAVRPSSGRITFEGDPIERCTPDQILRRGIALVPEGRRIFARLTVGENLRIGTTQRSDAAAASRDIKDMCDRFPVLGQSWNKSGAHLSGGEQQQLAIARALLSRPRLLLLDEPTLGLSPLMVDAIFDLVDELRRDGTTILLVEQNASRTVQCADRSYVMRSGGRIQMHGTAAELTVLEDFDTAYLGMSSKALA
jgi:branched-chain amino acid transport system ATP-binding protein